LVARTTSYKLALVEEETSKGNENASIITVFKLYYLLVNLSSIIKL